MTALSRPALLIAGCASGQGKTTVTAALARYHSRAGRRVRVFKTGPDFIDPTILEAASAASVYNIDTWMVGLEASKALLADAARNADLILVEGAMGLYDGEPSTADLAEAFGIPVAAVIDAGAMAQTFGALAQGLKAYRPVPFAGVIANRVAGDGHKRMLAESLPGDIKLLAVLPGVARSLPERHLGLLLADEIGNLSDLLDSLADAIGQSGDLPLPAAIPLQTIDAPAPERLLEGLRVAVAHDAAFSFLYRANIDCLQAMGARVEFFSPLANQPVPLADALYLPGGYPELHASRLSGDAHWLSSLRQFAARGKPVYAECGGMMTLFDSLATLDGARHPMAGLLPGHVSMRERVSAIGLQSLVMPQGTLRGHTFHCSVLETTLAPALECVPHGYGKAEPVFRSGSLTASYLHAYFASCPPAVAALMGGTP